MRPTRKNKRTSQHKRTVKALNCSPRPKSKTLDFTCFTSEMLDKLKNLWNARHPDVRIEATDPKQIWESLSSRLSNTCNTEACWLNQSFAKFNLDENLKNYVFAPKSPKSWKKNPNEWLSSVDILDIMKHYERNFKKFEFFGPSPIDFDAHMMYDQCVWEEICKFDLTQQIARGKTKLGFIFNLDKHNQPGSHWVALFVSVKKREIYYFDSYGDDAPPEILVLIKRIQEQSAKMGAKYAYKFNKKRHQFGNSECGMYSLYFLVHLIREKAFDTFNTERIKDKYVENLRKKYFN
jgi:hypothetical protein